MHLQPRNDGWSRLHKGTNWSLDFEVTPAVGINFNIVVVVNCSEQTHRFRQRTTLHKMSSEEPTNPMAESGVTVRSDSEQYSGAEEASISPPSSGSPAMILYQPPTIWGLLRGAAINLLLPFINGMMLGFGELFAHEAAFRLGWGGTRVRPSSLKLLSSPPGEAHPRRGLRKQETVCPGAETNTLLGIPPVEETIAPDRPRNRNCREVEPLAQHG